MTGLLTHEQLPPDFIQTIREKSRIESEREAWHQARLGKITGSRFGIVKKNRSGDWGETAQTYLFELIAEWLSGESAPYFTGNRATEWGNEHEPEALKLYESVTGRKVSPGKFHQAEGFQFVGATPDGLVGKGGMIEAKCPYMPKNHMRTLLTKQVPDEYIDQVDGHLMVTGRKWCDFISYDPRLPEERWRLAIVRVERNEQRINDLRDRLRDFETMLIQTLKDLDYPLDTNLSV